MTIKKRPLTALPDDPNSRFVPTPMAGLKKATPAQVAPFLALNVATSRPKDNIPARTSRAPIANLQKWSGNMAGSVRGEYLGPMRRDKFMGHLDGLIEAEVLKSYRLEGKRGDTLAWSWPSAPENYLEDEADDLAINRGLRGRGNHCMMPKAIAYDPRLSGAGKKLIGGVHFLRYVRRPASGEVLPWTDELEQGMSDLGDYIGLKRKAVSAAMEEAQSLGLLEIKTAPRMLTRIRIMPITANYVLIRTPKGYRKVVAHWRPLESAYGQWGYDEAWARVDHYRQTGEVTWENAQYWAVELTNKGIARPLSMDDRELREGFDYGNKGPVEGTMGDEDSIDGDYDDDDLQGAMARIEASALTPVPDMLGLEFDRRAQAIDKDVPASHERVARKAGEWLGSGSSRKEILAVMDLFFTGTGGKMLEDAKTAGYCGYCWSGYVRQCPPQCPGSLVQAFIDRAPWLSGQVAKQPLEQPKPLAEQPTLEMKTA